MHSFLVEYLGIDRKYIEWGNYTNDLNKYSIDKLCEELLNKYGPCKLGEMLEKLNQMEDIENEN